mgnify:CR=1 FL=1
MPVKSSCQQYILDVNDILILNFLAKVGYCQEHHLAKLVAIQQATLKSTLSAQITRLVKANLVTKTPFLREKDDFVLLGKEGAKQLQVNPVKGLILNTLNHDMLVIDLLLHFMHTQPQLMIKTDRELKRELGLVGAGISKANIPDLLINDSIAIEVELTAKTEVRLCEIVNSYILKAEIKEVHYYVQSQTIVNRIFNLTQASNKFRGFLFKEDIAQTEEVFAPHNLTKSKNLASTQMVAYNLDDYLSE